MSPQGVSEQPPVNPEMVTLARELRGLTQSEAAKRLRISQGTLSKVEAGVLPVSPRLLDQLCEVLGCPPQFFSLADRVYGPGTSEFFHRKRQSMSSRKLRKVYAELNVRRIQLTRLLRAVEIVEDQIPRLDLADFGTPEEVARAVRATWQLPPGAIKNVTRAVEDAGGLVILCNFGSPQLDAVSRIIPGVPPLFFLNESMPADRGRLTLGHELAHVVMHDKPHPEMEEEAFRFAAEFLMPEAEIRPYLDDLSLPKLASLKPYWKVSMAALLKRATDLGKISDRQARHLWMQLGKAGHRLQEPPELDVPAEPPGLITEIINLHRDKLGYSLPQLSALLAASEEDIRTTYDLEPLSGEYRPKLRVVG